MELLISRLIKKTAVLIFCLPLLIFAELPSKAREAIRPHELPVDHAVRSLLNKLFKKSRVIKNPESLERAGFNISGPRKFTGLIVAKHDKTPGYIYKIYTDIQEYYKNVPEYKVWLMRIEGARRIREYVEERQWGDQFKVPQKWIYIIPEGSYVDKGYYVKETVLVEEDMDLLSKKDNLKMWKGDFVTPALLDQIYSILKDIGLLDCAKPDNIPFSTDLKIAFIDTQTFDASIVSYERLTPFLNKPNKKHWRHLIK